MESNINYKHDFLKTSLRATIATFDNMFSEFSNRYTEDKKFPIYILNTGDEVFLSNLTDTSKEGNTYYEKIPRMVISLGDFNVDVTQLTSPTTINVMAKKDGINQMGKTIATRVPLNIVLKSKIQFSKIDEYLEFLEYFLCIMYSYSIYFNYSHGTVVYTGFIKPIYDYDLNTNFNMGFDSDSRNKTLSINWSLDVQMPALNIYNVKGLPNNELEYEPNIFFEDDYDINSKNDGTCGSGKENVNDKWLHRMFVNSHDKKGFVSQNEIKVKK